jgi:hypothetical protein
MTARTRKVGRLRLRGEAGLPIVLLNLIGKLEPTLGFLKVYSLRALVLRLSGQRFGYLCFAAIFFRHS